MAQLSYVHWTPTPLLHPENILRNLDSGSDLRVEVLLTRVSWLSFMSVYITHPCTISPSKNHSIIQLWELPDRHPWPQVDYRSLPGMLGDISLFLWILVINALLFRLHYHSGVLCKIVTRSCSSFSWRDRTPTHISWLSFMSVYITHPCMVSPFKNHSIVQLCVKYMTGRYDIETGSLMRGFRLQEGRTWLQLLRSCAFPRQGVLFQAEAKSSCGDPKRRSNKSEDRNSGEFTQEMRAKFVMRLGRY